jgi:hypothetical protein
MQFLGEAKSKEVRNSLPRLEKYDFNWENPPSGSPIYYWYYITQAYFQEGGAMWDAWNNKFSFGLVKSQDVINKEASGYVDHLGKPHAIGSWVSPSKGEHNGGNPVMDTILCTLMLEVYYRYLPTFMTTETNDENGPKEDIGEEDKDEIVIDFE